MRKRTERIGQLLFVATQAAHALATERLDPLGLSPRAWGVLSTLVESGPLTQIDLASALSIDRTAMVYLLDDLERRGLVKRVRNPDDRRSFLVHLTPKGERTQRKAAGELAEQTDVLLEPLDTSERRLLVELLTRIADRWEQNRRGGAEQQQAKLLEDVDGPSRNEQDSHRGDRGL